MNDTENLIFSLNATMPVFLMMVLGYVLHRKTSLLNDEFADYLNTFVFKLPLPVQLFKSLSAEDFYAVWDGGMVFFCFAVSLLSILLLLGLSLLLQDRTLRAEFVQAGYRGSQALLGVALLQNIYGSEATGGPLALVLIGAVPLYNVAAVLLTAAANAAALVPDTVSAGVVTDTTLRATVYPSLSRICRPVEDPTATPPSTAANTCWAPVSKE